MESKQVITKSDLTRLSWRSMFVVLTFNFERMMAPGFTFIQIPLLKKIYKDDPEGLKVALTDNMEFINTHPNFTGFLAALLLSMEETREDRNVIRGIKIGLYAPLAGIGDALFWFTLLPITAGICGSLALQGNIAGPIIFALVWFLMLVLRLPLTHLGYNLGSKSIDMISANTEKISRSASILGITVIGGLIASYVSLALDVQIPLGGEYFVDLQADLLDTIFPNILAFGFVFLCYYLLKRKQVNPALLIVGTFVVVLFASFIGIV